MDIDSKVIAAFIAAAAALFAAYITWRANKSIKLLEQKIKRQEESASHIELQLNRLYLPVSMNLASTEKLFHRYPNASDEEKVAIEHEFKKHNTIVKDCLMNSSIYLFSDAPFQQIDDLLEHLHQWEIVYKLKYEYKVYKGPVFAGIKEFGFAGFPKDKNKPSIDKYFMQAVRQLRSLHHDNLSIESLNNQIQPTS